MGTGREFVEKTKYKYLEPSDQQKGVSPPPLDRPSSGTVEELHLPKVCSDLGDIPLNRAMDCRKSLRGYSSEPLTMDEVSYLLWYTQGVKKTIPGKCTFRTVPSAGARHPFDTYILVNNATGMDAGLWHYMALEHRLAKKKGTPAIAGEMEKATLGQGLVVSSAATFIWVAVPYRTTWRYGERGYRYIYLDVGHVCQNLYLCAEAIGGGACAIGAFDDDQVNRILGLDGEEEYAIYLATVGKRVIGNRE